MGKVQLIRSQMSKTKDMMMTIGVNEKQHIDASHDMYFIRVHLNLRQILDSVTPDNIVVKRIQRMANRYIGFFRNDDEFITKNSLIKLLEWCKENNVNEIAFNEYEINKIDIKNIEDLANQFDMNINVVIER